MSECPEHKDSIPTQKTLAYLEACSCIFENGFLSKAKIVDLNSEVLQSIDKGYKFFTNWMSQICDKGTYIYNNLLMMI